MSSIYLSDVPFRTHQQRSDPLVRKIQRACRISLPEPDLALNLDVADYVNEKQGAAPREAALLIVKLINSKDTHTAIFALSLLDVLVKNCGYPFHLQISRKEFLNELVKRFPERPPMRYGNVQRLILTAIEEWYQTICKHSKYKEDMGYIRDMHRLLKYKGYTFPRINSEDLSVLRPSEHLKTPSEIQREQEVAQAAKLEELIRRGKPEDLKEANKLMKVMAGFKEDNVVQTQRILEEELTKLKRKADLLNEMLSASEISELDNETIHELYSSLKSSQPKFQKIIEEEENNDELVQSLLKFNDIVNQLVQKYNLLKNGNAGEAHQISVSNISSPPNISGALSNEINLIDFDDEQFTPSRTDPEINKGDIDLLADLSSMNLSASNQTLGLGGSIALGNSSIAPPVATTSTTTSTDHTNTSSSANIDLLSTLSSPLKTENPTAQPNGNSDLLSELTSSKPIGSSTPNVYNTPTGNVNQSSPMRYSVNTSDILKFEFAISRESENTIKLVSYFSNLSMSQISDLTLMLAVPKSQILRLSPQSSTTLSSFATDGIIQESWIDGISVNPSKPLRIKWKVSYRSNGVQQEESAVYTLPDIL